MKRSFFSLFIVGVMCLTFSTLAAAQNDNRLSSVVRDTYVISAKAGGVNVVEGKVSVQRAQKNAKSGYLLKGDVLEVGDKVTTGTDGRAEILLNPGSYVRLAENSSFEFVNTSLDDLQVKINRGSAMLEVITDDEFKVGVNTPNARFYIIDSGVYRVDTLADGSGKIAVWKGKAQVGDSNATIVKKGRIATVNGSEASVEKFDRDEKGTLENWSKDRAEYLAKINSKLQRDDVRNSLISAFDRRGWSMYDNYGLWYYNSFYGSYCFVPFGYGWSSPYGYGFGRDIWYFRLPRYIYYYHPSNNNNNNGNTGSVRPVRTKNDVPYQRIQRKVTPRVVSSDDAPQIYMPTRRPVVVAPSAPTPVRSKAN